MDKLFGFSKSKKLLKARKAELLCFNFINKPIRFRINHKAWLAIFFVAVIIPCLIKANTFLEVQKITKLNNSDFVSIVSNGKGFIDAESGHSARRIPIIKISKFWYKVGSEVSSGLVELFSPTSAFAEDVGKIRGKDCNRETSNESDDDLIHILVAFTLGFGFATLIVRLIVL